MIELKSNLFNANAGICRGHYSTTDQKCKKCVIKCKCVIDTELIQKKREETKEKVEPIVSIVSNHKRHRFYDHFFKRLDDGFDSYISSIKNEIETRKYYVGDKNLFTIQINKEGDMFVVLPSGKFEVESFISQKEATHLIKKIFVDCKLRIRSR